MQWTNLDVGAGVSGQPPSARSRHAMVAVDSFIIIFGGKTASTVSDELFRFETLTNKWTIIVTPGTAPSARYGHAMAAVDRNVCLFGGKTEFGKEHID